MAGKERITYDVDIRGRTEHLKRELKTLRDSFAGVALPTALTRRFEEVSALLDEIDRKTRSGIISRAGLKEVDGDFRKIAQRLGSLTEGLSVLMSSSRGKKIELLPADTQAKIGAIIEKLIQYE